MGVEVLVLVGTAWVEMQVAAAAEAVEAEAHGKAAVEVGGVEV